MSTLAQFALDHLFDSVAIAVSLIALVLSFVAYRQRVRYHEQPRLVVEWDDDIRPSNGLFLRSSNIYNRGDAPARDVRINVDSGVLLARQVNWEAKEILEPGKHLYVEVPVVDRVTKGYGSNGIRYDRQGDKSDYKVVTPTMTIQWRQAPFDRKPRAMKVRGPKTPNPLAGDTSASR